jgi:hypothetical protein
MIVKHTAILLLSDDAKHDYERQHFSLTGEYTILLIIWRIYPNKPEKKLYTYVFKLTTKIVHP